MIFLVLINTLFSTTIDFIRIKHIKIGQQFELREQLVK